MTVSDLRPAWNSTGTRHLRGAACVWLVLASLAASRPATAQGWSATLFVDPFPSPYASDWETNPNISSLTIVNPASTIQDVRLAYQVVNAQGRTLASGRSDPLGIPPGAPTVLTSILEIEGASSRDATIWDQMERTGRIPEGTYRACVVMAAANGLVLGEDCDTFTIVYPDPPQLIAPAPGEAITTPSPFFQWTPVVVPPAYPVQYALQVAEVLPNQTAEEALNATIVHYQQPDLTVTNVQYPVSAQPFEPGKRYAWRVVAIDEMGFPPTANGGLSEIRTFSFDDGSAVNGARTEILLTLSNDFDDEPADVAVRDNGTEEPPADIGQMCALWDQPANAYAISSASPIGLKRFTGQPAVLHRDIEARLWWIATKNPKNARAVLIGGDCKGLFKPTRVLWIASRDTAVQSEMNRAMASRSIGPDSLFGMVVLSVVSGTVEAPAGFDEATEFLGSYSVEVATGLNLFLSLNMKEYALWPWFESMGFKEKEFQLYGFLGWNSSMSVGLGAGQGSSGVDVSTERKFLIVQGSFPKLYPAPAAPAQVSKANPGGGGGGGAGGGGGGSGGGGGGRGGGGGGGGGGAGNEPAPGSEPQPDVSRWWRSQQLSIEISLGDSLGRLFTLDEHRRRKRENNYSLELQGKLIHTIEVNDELSLVGYLGLDLAYEAKRGPAKEVLARWDWMRRANRAVNAWLTDRNRMLPRIDAWIAGRIPPPSAEIADPELNLDAMFGYGAEGRIASIGEADGKAVRLEALNLDGKFRLTGGDRKLTLVLSGTAGLGEVEEAVKLGVSWTYEFGDDPLEVKKTKARETSLALKERMLAHAGELPDCGGSADHGHPICRDWRAYLQANKDVEDAENSSLRIRLSAGHMPLGEVLGLIKSFFAGSGT